MKQVRWFDWAVAVLMLFAVAEAVIYVSQPARGADAVFDVPDTRLLP